MMHDRRIFYLAAGFQFACGVNLDPLPYSVFNGKAAETIPNRSHADHAKQLICICQSRE